MKLIKSILFLLFISFFNVNYAQVETMDSGGPLMPEQAAYDATFYDITLTINPQDSTIQGFVRTEAEFVHPVYWFVLDLDSILAVESVSELQEGDMMIPRDFHRKGGKLWIDLKNTRSPGEKISITVNYGGKPRIAPRPPWDGGFTWKYTEDGSPWIATTCQTNGADLWWPNKDHVSDKPDSVGMHITVPEGLVVATNGKSMGNYKTAGNKVTYDWFVSTPISNYNIALNIAPYKRIDSELASVSGETFPVYFWVLPEDYKKGQKLFPQILEHLTFFEKLLGPYPFQQDKYGVVQTPHLGMEHQTIIAYGAKFSNKSMTGKDWGFDALHQHELAHEWWGNMVTNSDWRDMWIHEGFGSYMQALYVEELHGKEEYRKYMQRSRFFGNTRAIAPRKSMSAIDIYKAPIYTKGSWTLHNLRFLIGDDAFFKSLKEMCYAESFENKKIDGSQVHFATTDDFVNICEKNAGMELDWFFDVYVRQPKVPKLYSSVEKGVLKLKWESPDDLPFPMPVEVKINHEIKRYDIPKEGLIIPLKKGEKPEVDPHRWVLMDVSRA